MNNKANVAKKVNSTETKAVSKPSFNTATVEEMTASIEMVKRNIEQFKPKSRFRWAFNATTKLEVFKMHLSIGIAEYILGQITSDTNYDYLSLPNLSKDKYVTLLRYLRNPDSSIGLDVSITRALLIAGIGEPIITLLNRFNVEFECRLEDSITKDISATVYNQIILQAFDVLTFRLPNWLRTIKNQKLSAIGQQFQYMDSVLLKPASNSYYRFFVTDGYKSDILIKDKRSEKEYWISTKDNPHVPRIGMGEVRVFKINLAKGKKPYYTEIEFGSKDYTDIANTIPRISRELENEIALLKEEKIPASQDKLEALAAKFKR